MNGREFFVKYEREIDFLTGILSKFPRKFRQSRFEALRNKNGLLAILRRYLLLKTLVKQCGNNVAVFPGVFFENMENLSLGNNVSIHQMCYIDAEGGIDIGDNVSIAHRSTVLSSNHLYDSADKPIKYQGMELKATTIEENVWIGCGCTILAGGHCQRRKRCGGELYSDKGCAV